MKMHRNNSSAQSVSGSTRREFLKTGAKSLGGLALPALVPLAGLGTIRSAVAATSNSSSAKNKSVILVFLSGGPSQLDMYDMKPDAPAEIRGEFRPIDTNVPGVRVCEHLPLHAKIADKFSIINGVESIDLHDRAVTEACGRAAGGRIETIMPVSAEDGYNRLEIKSCQTLELPHGDWDTHGCVLGRELSIFDELREKVPAYDRAMHKLITDIYDRGLDKDVLIVACGEFGRAPWINQYGGRNHWAPSGSVLFAGGGLKMGQVIGDTGPIGEREQSRNHPYTWSNIYPVIFRHLEIDVPTVAQPIAELI